MESKEHSYKGRLTVPQAQEIIYDFLLKLVKSCPPDQVLQEFQHLFIQHDESSSSETIPALHLILFANDETEFRNTFKAVLLHSGEQLGSLAPIRGDSVAGDAVFNTRLFIVPPNPISSNACASGSSSSQESQDFQDLKLFAAPATQQQKPLIALVNGRIAISPIYWFPNTSTRRTPSNNDGPPGLCPDALRTSFKFDLGNVYSLFPAA